MTVGRRGEGRIGGGVFFKIEGAGVNDSTRGCITGEIDRKSGGSGPRGTARPLTVLVDAKADELHICRSNKVAALNEAVWRAFDDCFPCIVPS